MGLLEEGPKVICPLLSISTAEWEFCQKTRCAWWLGERCAVTQLGAAAEGQLLETERQELLARRLG